MRRLLLLPVLALSLAPFAAPASAGCEYDPEGNPQCHPVDCQVWNPQAPTLDDVLSDPAGAVARLLPPSCPAY